MLIVTGGAGFIGSYLVAELEKRTEHPIVVCDYFEQDQRWKNLAKRRLYDLVHPNDLLNYLQKHCSSIQAIFHLGAISTTTEKDVDKILHNNFYLSRQLLDWCTAKTKPLIYASSAATYGDGELGFKDDPDNSPFYKLTPLNPYGWSKHLFDKSVEERRRLAQELPPQLVGLKFFNVYGPNEYHKGGQASVVRHVFHQIKETGQARLFASDRPDYKDGEQLRDFIYVKDVVEVMLWFYQNPNKSGLFNVGTGNARSFKDLATAVFNALNIPVNIQYVSMPESLKGQYQYYTQADIIHLRAAGYKHPFTLLEDGVREYVQQYLNQTDSYH